MGYVPLMEAAEKLKYNPSALRRAAKNGTIPAVKVGNRWMLSDEEIPVLKDDSENDEISPVTTILKEFRIDRGYRSARAFCSEFGINYEAYLTYENGTKILRPDLAVKLADIFNCSLDTLYDREVPKSETEPTDVQKFYNSLPSELKAEMESFMLYLEYRARIDPPAQPSFMKEHDEMIV